jgi:MOSC domain-containing protein YiiM
VAESLHRSAWKGVVSGIHITPDAGKPMRSIEEVRAVEGKGLVGDRYFDDTGTWSRAPGGGREVTLIESEAVQAAGRDYNVEVDPGDARRNIVTSGVPLNHLVGSEFVIGEATLRGVRLCNPCAHMERLSSPGMMAALTNRGGLRAEVVRSGVIRVGDGIEPREP